MKVLTAKVVGGKLDVPDGILEEGATVTLLLPEAEEGFTLSQEEQALLLEAIRQADRGEVVNGWQLLSELNGEAASSRKDTEVRQLFVVLMRVVRRFEELFPGRRFTPDGHLVGSLGEVYAAQRYALNLKGASFAGCDAEDVVSRPIEIKVTQRTSVGFRSEPPHALVFVLTPSGEFEEIYNGPGSLVWANAGPPQRNGQRTIGVARLRRLMEQVPLADRLPTTFTQ